MTLTFTYKTPAANTTIPEKKVPHRHNNRINESVIENPASVFSNNVESSAIVIVGIINCSATNCNGIVRKSNIEVILLIFMRDTIMKTT